MRWFCFTVRGLYVGKCMTSEEEIRATFRAVEIIGNHVAIIAP